jgi:hypothetical protein
MANCIVHSGAKAVAKVNGVDVCETCKTDIAGAVKRVDKHVEPKACFVWYKDGKSGWQPIPGTGCAHWVAHQRGITAGSKGEKCMLGYPFRVTTMLGSRSKVELADVKVNDIYVTPSKDHTGLVLKVTVDPKAPDKPKITIRHDSSGQGGVSDNDFATHFKGNGSFHR